MDIIPRNGIIELICQVILSDSYKRWDKVKCRLVVELHERALYLAYVKIRVKSLARHWGRGVFWKLGI